MEQKLQNLLQSVPPRAAWITAGSCVCFWLVSLTGVLTPPLSAPASLTLFWFYAMLMLALASGIAVVGAAAVLLVRRRRPPAEPAADTADPDATAPDAAEQETADDQDHLSDLGQILDNPGRDRR